MNIKKELKKLEYYRNYLNTKRPLNKDVVSILEKDLKTNFIYNTNAIEGNTLSYKETEVILEYGITVKGKSLNEHLEVKGQEYALNFLEEEVNRNSEISTRLIKEFHQLVLQGINPSIAGVLKKGINKIGGSNTNTSSPFEVEAHLTDLIAWYNSEKDMNIIEKVTKFHADFEKIHPFDDGNGRTGRLIMNLELMKKGYPICIIQKEERLEYYDRLELAQTKEDYNKIIEFVISSVEKTFEFYFDRIDPNWKEELKFDDDIKI